MWIVSSEQISKYTTTIDRIIANGDLETISTKQIRNGLQMAVDEDLSEYKVHSILPCANTGARNTNRAYAKNISFIGFSKATHP